MSNEPWFKQHADHITLSVKVRPGMKQNSISISTDNVLVISIQAPAEEGQANKRLIKYLAKLLQVHQNKITIQQGSVCRKKVICIKVMPSEQGRIKTRMFGFEKK